MDLLTETFCGMLAATLRGKGYSAAQMLHKSINGEDRYTVQVGRITFAPILTEGAATLFDIVTTDGGLHGHGMAGLAELLSKVTEFTSTLEQHSNTIGA